MDNQTGEETDRQRYGQSGKETDRQRYGQSGKETDRHPDIQAAAWTRKNLAICLIQSLCRVQGRSFPCPWTYQELGS